MSSTGVCHIGIFYIIYWCFRARCAMNQDYNGLLFIIKFHPNTPSCPCTFCVCGSPYLCVASLTATSVHILHGFNTSRSDMGSYKWDIPSSLCARTQRLFVSKSKHVAACLLVVLLFIILMVRKVFCAVSKGGKVGTFKSVNIFGKWPLLNIMGCILGGK